MITDHAVLLHGSVASRPGVTLVARTTPSMRSLHIDELSTAVDMQIRLLENMDTLSGEHLPGEPGAAGKIRVASQTPDETPVISEADSPDAYEPVATEARVIPAERPEVFPAAGSDTVSVTPARSVEYQIIEPSSSDIVLIPEANALDLTA